MDINNFLAIGIVGSALSLAFQYFKTVSGTKAKVWSILLSVLVGGVYTFLVDTVWWTTIVGVLAASSTVYALFLNNKE